MKMLMLKYTISTLTLCYGTISSFKIGICTCMGAVGTCTPVPTTIVYVLCGGLGSTICDRSECRCGQIIVDKQDERDLRIMNIMVACNHMTS